MRIGVVEKDDHAGTSNGHYHSSHIDLCTMARTTNLILLTAFWLCSSLASAQEVHTIRGLDFYYLPDTVWMLAGDSIHFQTVGIHNMVQTDSSQWAIGQAVSNGGFATVIQADTTFVIDTVGTYYFVCAPHGFVGMRGVLFVEAPSSLTGSTRRTPSTIELYPIPTRQTLFVELAEEADVKVTDVHGKQLGSARKLPVGKTQFDVSEYDPGIYILYFQYTKSKRVPGLRRFMIGP